MDSTSDDDSDSSSESGNYQSPVKAHKAQKEDLSNASGSPENIEKKLIRRLSSIDSNKHSTFDELLRCSICLDEYKLPKALPCQHSFCAACLKPLLTLQMRLNLENYRRIYVPTIQCPICRKFHALTPSGIEGLPNNYTLLQLMELRSNKDNKSSLIDVERLKSPVEDPPPDGNKIDHFERERILRSEIGQPISHIVEVQPQVGRGHLMTNIGIFFCVFLAMFLFFLGCSWNNPDINSDSNHYTETSAKTNHVYETSAPYLKSNKIFTKECLESESNSCLILYIPRKVDSGRDASFNKAEEKEITKLANTLDKLKIYRSDNDEGVLLGRLWTYKGDHEELDNSFGNEIYRKRYKPYPTYLLFANFDELVFWTRHLDNAEYTSDIQRWVLRCLRGKEKNPMKMDDLHWSDYQYSPPKIPRLKTKF